MNKIARYTLITISLFLFCQKLVAEDYSYKLLVTKVGKNSWEIEYRFDALVSEISFNTNPNSMREKYWEILPSNYSLTDTRASGQVLSFSESINHIRILINDEDMPFYQREYTPFLKFFDGSAAIYLGHYILSSVATVDGEIEKNPKVITTLQNRQESSVYFVNKKANKKLQVKDLTPSTYAYFGDLKIKNLPRLNLLMDPELPSWIFKAYKEYLPMIIRYYEESTGIKLRFKPDVFINYYPHAKRTSFDGGVIGNQVLINFKGSGWQSGRKDNYVNVLKLLFHEASHLWNGTLFKNRDITKKIWVHEGMAEYFATKGLYDLGVISAAKYKELNVKTIEDCSLGLISNSVNQLNVSSDMERIYSCGSSLFFISERIKDETVYEIWEEMLDTKSGLYSESSFLKLSWSDPVHHSFYEILNGQSKSALDSYLHLLSSADIGLKQQKSEKYLSMLRGKIIKHLMQTNCSRVGYWTHENYYKTESISGCGVFEEERKVTGVGTHNLFKHIIKAYDYVYKKCLSKEPLKVNLISGESIFVNCGQEIDPLPMSISPVIR